MGSVGKTLLTAIALFLVLAGPAFAATPAPGLGLQVAFTNTGACAGSTPCSAPILALAPARAIASAPLQTQPANNGFALAWVIVALMVLALLYVLLTSVQLNRGAAWPLPPNGATVLLPVLAVLGLGVALYLTYVETSQVNAVCGPVGNCNAVQSSPYAKLFGVLPVGLLGALGYLGILAAFALSRWNTGSLGDIAPMGLLGMAAFGVIFSLWLTYLELFVILAVCIWCLSSAVIMSLILVLSVGPAMVVMGPEEVDEVVDQVVD
jgi:uncharacterized membrane protein